MTNQKDERARRLAEALRANLRKRKEGGRQEQTDSAPNASVPERNG